ncbi:putative membrane protein insertion efficiency factor [Orientia chuto str. Dubai]|uniref:Putative membrane protein insertion efficiency factor n=1 Tax=Orientia chuto str. Dubai TaxID=1359168 RepID=A0A0F3MNG5_9RICK|nr:membrane protein insertion efficiency factor YidD [Candidatus Orientia mediorientalis]KJV56119.1 putative membrane protein insertion efficiency factor [Orientia chuto str. Dubai]
MLAGFYLKKLVHIVYYVIFIVVVLSIRIYQLCISPYLKPNCRFTPTCSEYSIQVISRYGLIKGIYLCLKRIFQCHPFA